MGGGAIGGPLGVVPVGGIQWVGGRMGVLPVGGSLRGGPIGAPGGPNGGVEGVERRFFSVHLGPGVSGGVGTTSSVFL